MNSGAANKRAKRSVTATITPASASVAPATSVAPSSVNKVNSNVDAGADPGPVGGGGLVIKDEPIEAEDSSGQLTSDNTSPPTIGGNPPDPAAAPEHLVIPTDPALMRGISSKICVISKAQKWIHTGQIFSNDLPQLYIILQTYL